VLTRFHSIAAGGLPAGMAGFLVRPAGIPIDFLFSTLSDLTGFAAHRPLKPGRSIFQYSIVPFFQSTHQLFCPLTNQLIRNQPSAISYQLSAISYQQSAIS
jgi:hypothetical protein